MPHVTIVECPRDAWQGLPGIIPTEVKAAYLRTLVRAGFRHLDAASFVSPKYVPQMADSEAVLAELSPAAEPAVEIIGIVVEERGLARALAAPGLTTVGYPHSLSETFMKRNANSSVEASRELLGTMVEKTGAAGRRLVVYLSMAFGNPYGEPWEIDTVAAAVRDLAALGVRTVSLADTAGAADAARVGALCRAIIPVAAGLEIGVHLHSRPDRAEEKVLAAFDAGCRRFDSALTGLGGCPFAADEMVGNIPTETALAALAARGVDAGPAPDALADALAATEAIRSRYAHAPFSERPKERR